MANIYLLVINVFSKNDKRSKIQQMSSCNCVLRSTVQIPMWISVVQSANQNNGAALPDIIMVIGVNNIQHRAVKRHTPQKFLAPLCTFCLKNNDDNALLSTVLKFTSIMDEKGWQKKTCKKIYCFSVRFTISIGSSYKKTPTTTIWESRFLSTILMSNICSTQ